MMGIKEGVSTLLPPLLSLLTPITAQNSPPCPPYPEFPGGFDPAKCACFYALVGSGLDLGSPSTFANAMDANTVQNFAQTGTYTGIDEITEYLSFVRGGTFVSDYVKIGNSILLDVSVPSTGMCAVTSVERRRLPFNSQYTKDNTELCVDAVAGATITFQLTGNVAAPILVLTINAWLPDAFIPTIGDYLSGTSATAGFVCDVLLSCIGIGPQWPWKKICLKKYGWLPEADVIDGLTYIDGNSQGCRVLHSQYASTNPVHCPHVTFRFEADVLGRVKCAHSKGTKPTDLFPQDIIDAFIGAGQAVLGFDATSIIVQENACEPA